MCKKAVFVDRDGTINVEKGYVHKIEDFEFIPGALEALRLLTTNKIKIYILTNHAGIAKGYFTEENFHELTNYMIAACEKEGSHIENVL
jgi:D-glycero-D-manno-heptose 1,7-bisphosphate phosphatase